MSEIEDRINNLFAEKQNDLEKTIDIKKYGEALVREVNHRVLCKKLTSFELWLKVTNKDNIAAVVSILKQVFVHSTFIVRTNDVVSKYIACDMHIDDVNVINTKLDSEQQRRDIRMDVIEQLSAKQKTLQEDYDHKMTLLHQMALDLQKKRDREIAEVHARYLNDRKEIENKMNNYPKECKETLEEIEQKLTLLKKCSDGFSY